MEIAIPLAALLISLVTFAISRVDKQHSASRDWVSDLQTRVSMLSDEVDKCNEDRGALRIEVDHLRDREIALMRRLVDVERKVSGG